MDEHKSQGAGAHDDSHGGNDCVTVGCGHGIGECMDHTHQDLVDSYRDADFTDIDDNTPVEGKVGGGDGDHAFFADKISNIVEHAE